MESGEKPPPEENRNPLWKPAVSILVLASALWVFDRSQNSPVFSLLGLLGVVSVVFAAAVTVVGQDRYHRFVGQILDWLWRISHRAGGALAAALRVATTLVRRHRVASAAVVAALLVSSGAVGWLSVREQAPTACPHPQELRLLTTPAGLATYQELARRYERYTADQRRDYPLCPTEHLYVYAPPPDLVGPALINRWRPDGELGPKVILGPQPDAWLPESTVDVRLVQDLAHRSWLHDPVRAARSIGSSALVLASTAPIDGLSTANPTWSDAVAAVVGSGIQLLAPDPQASTAGLFAMSTYLRGASGPVGLNEARRREQLIDESGSVLRDDDLATMCRFADAKASGNRAVITSRQTWQRYLDGKRLGGSCAAATRRGGQFVALADSPVLDHPLVYFDWTSEGRRAALDAFLGWLATTSGDDARRVIGLDPSRPDCNVLLKLDGQGQDINGAKESPLTVPDPCMPQGLEDALSRYREAQRPGAVLLAVDASGSMGAVVRRDGSTRLSVATQAVDRALDQIGPRDAVGVWTFAGPGYAKDVPLARGDPAQRSLVGHRLGQVRPGGSTPLYATILAGFAEVGRYGAAQAPQPSRALVVLTDGEDSSRTAVAQVAAGVRQLAQGQAAPRLFIVATGSATCAGANGLRVLTDAGRGTCYETDLNQVGQTMAALFESLWKGQ